MLLLAGAACDADDAPLSRRPADTSDSGARDAAVPPGCSVELCMPYTCDARFDSCRTSCSEPEHCMDGYSCRDGFCVGMECGQDGDAGSPCGGYACVLGRCAKDCALGPCTPGFYCRGDSSQCVPRCTSRDDARCSGYVCDLEVGECEPYCRDGELPCASGFTCSTLDECEPRP